MSHGLYLQTQVIFAAALTVKCHGYVFSCIKLSPCSCRLQMGSVIDLAPIGRQDGKPAFTGIKDTSHGVYEFNPCFNFTDTDSGEICKNVAICRKNTTDQTYRVLGVQQNVSFGYDRHSSLLFLRYFEIEEETRVFLQCTPHNRHSSLTATASGDGVHVLTLHSPYGCPAGVSIASKLSIGTIICIVFICIVLIYIGSGVLYHRVVHQAKGWDMLPNRTFWHELPGLVQDGYLFFISPCLGNTVSYRAYRYEPL